MTVAGANWAGNHVYGAAALHRPTTLDELREVLTAASHIRVLGSRHSFNDIADGDELVSLDALPSEMEVDPGRQVVWVGGSVRYGELAEALEPEGLALQNLASLPHISVAGAVATATHGSGNTYGNLSTSVAGLELVTSEGEVVRAHRGDADFDGMVVNLGALGAVTRVALDVEPAYQVRQRVFEGLAWDALVEHFDAITEAGQSVSVFSRWGASVEQVWIKSRVTDTAEEVREDLFGAAPATVHRHPIMGLDPVNCSPQLGIPGLWSDRLSHFRMGFTPSTGEEIQSEYLVPRANAVEAIRAMRTIGDMVRPLLQVCEIRTVAADSLWMSPQYGRDTVGIHFTWIADSEAVAGALVDVEPLLLEHDARPHWGKVFRAGAEQVAPRYERLGDFTALCERLDPRGVFRNRFLEEHLLGAA